MDVMQKIIEAINEEETDTVIPTLSYVLAMIGREICPDKDVLIGYITKVIDTAYAERKQKQNIQ